MIPHVYWHQVRYTTVDLDLFHFGHGNTILDPSPPLHEMSTMMKDPCRLVSVVVVQVPQPVLEQAQTVEQIETYALLVQSYQKTRLLLYLRQQARTTMYREQHHLRYSHP